MKKILSLILALSLIVSVAPMSFAAESEETTDEPGMYFNFGAAGYGSTTEDIDYGKISSYDDCYMSGTSQKYKTPTYATTDIDQWYIDGESSTYGADNFFLTDKDGLEKDTDEDGVVDDVYQPDALSFKSKGTNALTSKGYVARNTVVAISLNVNESGTFVPWIEYHVGPKLPKCDVYLVPKTWKEYTSYSLKQRIGFSGACKNYATMSQQIVINRLRDSAKYPEVAGFKLGTIDMYAEKEGTREIDLTPYIISDVETDYILFLNFAGVNDTVKAAVKSGSSYDLPDYVTSIYSFELAPAPADIIENMTVTATPGDPYTIEPTTTVSRLALYGDISDTIGTESVTYGKTATINEVPATVTREDGTYNFLYWAKGLDNGVGNKHIISTSNAEFSYKPHEGANYLIAVYEKAGAEKAAAFYNYNGQLLTDLEITDNLLPALPAMAGLGDAIGWEQLGTGEVFAAEYDISELEGDKVFMAKYEEPTAGITINGSKYAYGAEVVCEDLANTGFEADTFSYWTKTVDDKVQIISFDSEYTFNAWENCTVKAFGNVELSRAARKILLSTFSVGENLTAVMAEFIGFDSAKEKGIMFGEKKIAMTTDYAQFTITNDTDAAVTVTGYAIVDDGGETVKYTDGSISVAGVQTTAE